MAALRHQQAAAALRHQQAAAQHLFLTEMAAAAAAVPTLAGLLPVSSSKCRCASGC
jgi:hypothetical protein